MRPRPALDDFLARLDVVLASSGGVAPDSRPPVRAMPPPQVHSARWSARGVFSRA